MRVHVVLSESCVLLYLCLNPFMLTHYLANFKLIVLEIIEAKSESMGNKDLNTHSCCIYSAYLNFILQNIVCVVKGMIFVKAQAKLTSNSMSTCCTLAIKAVVPKSLSDITEASIINVAFRCGHVYRVLGQGKTTEWS